MLRSLSLLCCLLYSLVSYSQPLFEKLQKLPGITIYKLRNNHFHEYYELTIEQLIDHKDPQSEKFKQRIIIGFNSFDSSVVMDTDGYGINYALSPSYKHELSSILNSNLIIIEHRFFGSSVPDSLNYNFLTTAQVAADVHYIRTLFGTILSQKWISTGISKGGQAALAHKINYPADVYLTILYGTAVKKGLIENKIDSMLNFLSTTECGRKLNLLQTKLLEHRKALLPQLDQFIIKNGIDIRMKHEIILDYMILELPFSFWQSGAECIDIPSSEESPDKLFRFLSSIISPSFYSAKTLKRLQPAFYMSYHELGYYEYNTKKLKGLLTEKNYSNKIFAPQNIQIKFDQTYLKSLNTFLETKDAEKVIFIYGEKDPWSSMQNTGKASKYIIKNGSHKSRIVNMLPTQRNFFDTQIRQYLN
ncbi:MAG: ptp [Bacteroidetes bacterium]|jgi:hypothetical protein|nr:ptp [Bacteroidota bacterium]